MAFPFQATEYGDGSYAAYLTTGERLFLVRAIADILELLGQDDDPGAPERFEEQAAQRPLKGRTPKGLTQRGLRGPSETSRRIDDDPAELGAAIPAPGAQNVPGMHGVPGAPWEIEAPDDPRLVEQLEAALSGLDDEDPLPPTDPAIRRLLPDASLDPEVAAEFRRYTDFELREQKVSRLLLLSDRLTDVTPSSVDDEHLEFLVEEDEAEPVASALGDIRLVLGERLGLHSDRDAQELYDRVVTLSEQLRAADGDTSSLGQSDERVYVMGILFELAGYLQESLTGCMLETLRQRRRNP
jgi:hypothetical protein